MTTTADESQPTSAAGRCVTESSKALAANKTTTSQDAYCIKQKANQTDPFVRYQQAKNLNPQVLSYNCNLAYLDNKFLDGGDREVNLPMTTTSRRMNVRIERFNTSCCTLLQPLINDNDYYIKEWVESLSQTPNKGSWKRSVK